MRFDPAPLRTAPLLFALLLGCGGDESEDWKKFAEKSVDPTTVVEVLAASRGDVIDTLETSTTVESESQADVIPTSSGIVLSVHKEIGDPVRKGDLLAVIDNVNLLEGASRAAAEVNRLEDQVNQMRTLRTQGAVSERELRDLEHQLTTARSTLVEASDGAGQTRLKAPFAGVVAARNIRKGQLASGSAAAFQVVDPDTLEVVAQLPPARSAQMWGTAPYLSGVCDRRSRR